MVSKPGRRLCSGPCRKGQLSSISADVLPGRRVARVLRTFTILAERVPPRVFAAALRTICNGWVARRRFHQVGRCVLGCPQGEDSIKHYTVCSCFHGLCQRHLGLGQPPRSRCLGDFLGVDPYLPALPRQLATADVRETYTALRAISVYALYRCHGSARHGALPSAECREAFLTYVREAARDHRQAFSLLSRVRARPRDGG